MYNEALQQLMLSRLSGYPADYLPKVNYSKFYIDSIETYLSKCGEYYKVFIDNGDVLSLQANNFDFTPVIQRLGENHSNFLFITSKPMENKTFGNIICSSEIIQSPYDSDLIENGYISKFCKLIVGRNSGPFVFSGTDENLNDRNKTFISFCHEQRVATFHINQRVLSKQIWSGVTDPEGVYKVIDKEL
jgi:hypothetical protein